VEPKGGRTIAWKKTVEILKKERDDGGKEEKEF